MRYTRSYCVYTCAAYDVQRISTPLQTPIDDPNQPLGTDRTSLPLPSLLLPYDEYSSHGSEDSGGDPSRWI
jgi:hypothetical protein